MYYLSTQQIAFVLPFWLISYFLTFVFKKKTFSLDYNANRKALLENALSQYYTSDLKAIKIHWRKKNYHLEETRKLIANNVKLPKDKIMYEDTECCLYFLCHFCYWRLSKRNSRNYFKVKSILVHELDTSRKDTSLLSSLLTGEGLGHFKRGNRAWLVTGWIMCEHTPEMLSREFVDLI